MEDRFHLDIDCDCHPGADFGPSGRARMEIALDERSRWIFHAWLGRGCVDRLVVTRDGLDIMGPTHIEKDDGQRTLGDFPGGEAVR